MGGSHFIWFGGYSESRLNSKLKFNFLNLTFPDEPFPGRLFFERLTHYVLFIYQLFIFSKEACVSEIIASMIKDEILRLKTLNSINSCRKLAPNFYRDQLMEWAHSYEQNWSNSMISEERIKTPYLNAIGESLVSTTNQIENIGIFISQNMPSFHTIIGITTGMLIQTLLDYLLAHN